MVEIILPLRYIVVFDGAESPASTETCMSYTEAITIASQHTHPETPWAAGEAVVRREAHCAGKWGEHSCARFVGGVQVFPIT